MAYQEVSAPFGDGRTEAMATLYPELRGRTLGQLLRAELGGEPTISVDGDYVEGEMTTLCVTVEGENRKSQVHLAAQERLIMSDLWEVGVCVGNAASPSFSEIIAFFRIALVQNLSLTALQKAAPCFRASDKGLAQEKGAVFYVDKAWEDYTGMLGQEHPTSRMAPLFSLLEAAAQVAQLRQLMVFTSMYWLCFSRCTGYPFSGDCPCAGYNAETNQYEVYPAEETLPIPTANFSVPEMQSKPHKCWPMRFRPIAAPQFWAPPTI